jgi:hypothetical protein
MTGLEGKPLEIVETGSKGNRFWCVVLTELPDGRRVQERIDASMSLVDGRPVTVRWDLVPGVSITPVVLMNTGVLPEPRLRARGIIE